jgi:hypothetical protein
MVLRNRPAKQQTISGPTTMAGPTTGRRKRKFCFLPMRADRRSSSVGIAPRAL